MRFSLRSSHAVGKTPRLQANILFGALLLASFIVSSSFAQRPGEDSDTYQKRSKWYQDARFGMFIHWDPSSVAAKEISWANGCKKPLERSSPSPGPDLDCPYDTLYRVFNPTEFDAGEYVRIALDAGMKYMVMIAKHHGGFAMWDTKYMSSRDTVPYSIMRTPYKKDIIKQMSDSCHAYGLPFGVYYSQRDWYNSDYGMPDSSIYIQYMRDQLKELMTQYGKVEVIWWDSYRPPYKQKKGQNSHSYWHALETLEKLYDYQPTLMSNNRIAMNQGDSSGLGYSQGDFDTQEKAFIYPRKRPVWESCMTMNNTWSWGGKDDAKPTRTLIKMLVIAAVQNGNFLLNIGPKGDGTIPSQSLSRLSEIGKWTKKYGESIYGTRKGPFKIVMESKSRGGDTVGCAVKDSIMYVHITRWKGDITLPSISEKIVGTTARHLNTGGTVSISQSSGKIRIRLPSGVEPDSIDDVIAIKMDAMMYDTMKYATPVPVIKPLMHSAKMGAAAKTAFRVCGDRIVLNGIHAGKTVDAVLYTLDGRAIRRATIRNGTANLRRDFGVPRGVYIVSIR